MSLVSVENLDHIYNRGTPLQTVSLRKIDLVVESGEFVALVGAAGSGKSTLLHHLNGALVPTGGRVLVGGQDTRLKSVRKSLWRTVGLVLQFPERQFFEETVFQEVAFGPANMGLPEEEINSRFIKSLEMTGLDAAAIGGQSPNMLSGGEQRRVALASILAMGTPLLALDEPTAGIDPRGKKQVMECLKSLSREKNTAIIAAGHDLDELAEYADRVVVLREGRIILDGPARDVFATTGQLRLAGLDLPFTCMVAEKMSLAGCPLPVLPLSMEEAVSFIVAEVQDGKNRIKTSGEY